MLAKTRTGLYYRLITYSLCEKVKSETGIKAHTHSLDWEAYTTAERMPSFAREGGPHLSSFQRANLPIVYRRSPSPFLYHVIPLVLAIMSFHFSPLCLLFFNVGLSITHWFNS